MYLCFRGIDFASFYDFSIGFWKCSYFVHTSVCIDMFLNIVFWLLLGSVIGYMQSDDYDSMINVLMNMSDSEKKRLVLKVQELVGGIGIQALTRFIGNQAQREVLLHLIQGFAKNPQGG